MIQYFIANLLDFLVIYWITGQPRFDIDFVIDKLTRTLESLDRAPLEQVKAISCVTKRKRCDKENMNPQLSETKRTRSVVNHFLSQLRRKNSKFIFKW